MKLFAVTVYTGPYSSHLFIVNAKTDKEARRLAIDVERPGNDKRGVTAQSKEIDLFKPGIVFDEYGPN